ncbi:MAG: hypothetical protein H0U27_14850 [Nitrosopumilus sp.]|nr:hypothetical protein [Nitrosopumilus sp.]
MRLPNGWTSGHLMDKMFNNLKENGYDGDKKENKYFVQIIDKLSILE